MNRNYFGDEFDRWVKNMLVSLVRCVAAWVTAMIDPPSESVISLYNFDHTMTISFPFLSIHKLHDQFEELESAIFWASRWAAICSMKWTPTATLLLMLIISSLLYYLSYLVWKEFNGLLWKSSLDRFWDNRLHTPRQDSQIFNDPKMGTQKQQAKNEVRK